VADRTELAGTMWSMMITIRLLSQTFLAPIFWNDLIAKGPVRSCIMATSMLASTISPDVTSGLSEALAKIFSIMFIAGHSQSVVS
jgi:hypothetical protein